MLVDKIFEDITTLFFKITTINTQLNYSKLAHIIIMKHDNIYLYNTLRHNIDVWFYKYHK